MNREPFGYISYLLRLWYAGSDDSPRRRAALKKQRSGERQVFGDLAALFVFLEEQTRGSVLRRGQPPAEWPDDPRLDTRI